MAYLRDKKFITVRQMQEEFGLTKYSAHCWLRQFTDEGAAHPSGRPQQPVLHTKINLRKYTQQVVKINQL